jgi:hypothetical protein
VHVVAHPTPFQDATIFLIGALSEDHPEMLTPLVVPCLTTAFRDEGDRVFALPLGMA